ncbi:hypothetical protein KSP40_PGU008635 [Platanthera guangdongensis]|uniref:Uncharacterized protein n=1 Tax=Platanthera guangdongensis TaxID=2320717 RepID=A0ABR2LKJ0_9ASPA
MDMKRIRRSLSSPTSPPDLDCETGAYRPSGERKHGGQILRLVTVIVCFLVFLLLMAAASGFHRNPSFNQLRQFTESGHVELNAGETPQAGLRTEFWRAENCGLVGQNMQEFLDSSWVFWTTSAGQNEVEWQAQWCNLPETATGQTAGRLVDKSWVEKDWNQSVYNNFPGSENNIHHKFEGGGCRQGLITTVEYSYSLPLSYKIFSLRLSLINDN